jgi:hypothetical protein
MQVQLRDRVSDEVARSEFSTGVVLASHALLARATRVPRLSTRLSVRTA